MPERIKLFPFRLVRALPCCAAAFFINADCDADDWPRWLGAEGDSVWREAGIIEAIPESGLKFKWRHPVGLGYSGPAVADGKVYVLDYLKTSGEVTNRATWKDDLEGRERVLCFSAATGELLWEYAYPRRYLLSFPSGPRCTPTVADGKVYTLGAEGDLVCLDAASGKKLWSVAFNDTYATETPLWGYASHPLVAGDSVYCVVGGEGSVAVAFHKDTGKEVWRSLSAAEPGYCPPSLIDHGGVRQLLIWHPEGLNSLNPLTGEVYWSVPLKPSYGFSVVTPRKQGDRLFLTGMGRASALLKLDDTKPGYEMLWRADGKNAVYCGISTPFVSGDMVYGCDIESGALIGVWLADGERLWTTMEPTARGMDKARHGSAFIVRHAGAGSDRYFLFSESGELILADLSPGGYRELGRFPILEPTNRAGTRQVVWSHPAFAEKSIFARNDKEIVCVDLAAQTYAENSRPTLRSIADLSQSR
jgi:outer membrane protein assembly factor BamB